MKIIGKALGIAALLSAAACYRMWDIYMSTRPHLAYPEYGQVYAISGFGRIAYVTRTEQMQLYGIGLLAAACLLGAIAIDLFAARPERESSERRDSRE